MLEKYIARRFALDRYRASAVGPYIDGFAATLLRQGYAWQTGRACLYYAMHLGRWMARRGLAVETLDDHLVAEFEGHLAMCDCPGERSRSHVRAGSRVRAFLAYLRERGVAAPAPVDPGPAQPESLLRFQDWMRRQRGASEATVRAYSRVVRGLIERLGEDPGCYAPQALRRTALDLSAGWGTSKAEQVVTATRMFLGYLAVIGRCSPHLACTIPSVAAWTQTTLPKHLQASEVERLIASCEAAPRSWLRDRAILLLLARLGLRAGDVAGLRLADIDWADASLRVCGKGRREARLPLPQDVGDAVLAYIERGRPPIRSDRVFLTARAPWRPISANATLAGVVGRAIRRSGVDAPTHGTHLLRHTAATSMLREGASLQGIGAVLRHQSIETTVQYARVDGRLLKQVAQPWPQDLPDEKDAPLDLHLLGRIAQPWMEGAPC